MHHRTAIEHRKRDVAKVVDNVRSQVSNTSWGQ